MIVKTRFVIWCRQPENIGVFAIAALMLVLHCVALFQVHDYIYDEIASIAEANYVLHGDELDTFYIEWGRSNGFPVEEYLDSGYLHHMPLGKLILAAGIGVFGDDALGWRVFSVLFGVMSILLFYLICQKLSSRKWLPLVATFIFAFDNMCFVMSGLALLDVYSLTFLMGAFLLYLHGKLIPAGIVLALGALSKIIVAFGGIVILLHWIFVRRAPVRDAAKFLIVAPLTFVALLPLLDYIAVGEFIPPWDRLWSFVDIHDDPSLAQGIAEYRALFGAFLPWEWLTMPRSMIIWADPSYELNVNWTLWGLIIPVMCYIIFEGIKQRWNSLCMFAFLWFVCGYLPWFIIYWAFDRVSYPFYFYTIVPAVCLAAGYAVCRIVSFSWGQNSVIVRWSIMMPAILWMAAHFVMFFMMAPII